MSESKNQVGMDEPITGAVILQRNLYAQPWPAKHTGLNMHAPRTREALERSCALEGGADAIAFASGLATATIYKP